MSALPNLAEVWARMDKPFLQGIDYIETGVSYGDSLAIAAKWPFAQLHGIELSDRAAVAKTRFESDSRVYIHHQSSPDILPKLLDPERPILAWLDAHYMGNGDFADLDPKYGQCTLLDELKAIMAVPWEVKPVILIDDIAQCGASEDWWVKYGHAFKRSQWPTFGSIMDLLPRATILIKNGITYCWWE